MWEIAIPIVVLAGMYCAVVLIFVVGLRQLYEQIHGLGGLLGRTTARVVATVALVLGILFLETIIEMAIEIVARPGAVIIAASILGPSVVVALVSIWWLRTQTRGR